MKKLVFLFCLFFLGSFHAKPQCRNTFLYGFELTGISHPENVTATVFYNRKPIVPKVKMICGKSIKIKTTFTYLKNATKTLNGIKLPYQLPANRFYWLMTDDMNIEMAVHPDRFKIVLSSNDKYLNNKYELPITYDFLAQNAIYLDLIDKSEAIIQKLFENNIWKFGLYEKQKEPIAKDSVLVFSVRKGIPLGIKTRFPQINEQTIHSTEEYTTSAMLYKGKLFLKIPENKMTKQKPDAQSNFYITIDGKNCATSGGIGGAGFGECAGATLKNDNKPITYQINIQLEP